MTSEELNEYNNLADKRDSGKLTDEEYIRWKQLVNESLTEALPTIIKTWMNGFGIN